MCSVPQYYDLAVSCTNPSLDRGELVEGPSVHAGALCDDVILIARALIKISAGSEGLRRILLEGEGSYRASVLHV